MSETNSIFSLKHFPIQVVFGESQTSSHLLGKRGMLSLLLCDMQDNVCFLALEAARF